MPVAPCGRRFHTDGCRGRILKIHGSGIRGTRRERDDSLIWYRSRSTRGIAAIYLTRTTRKPMLLAELLGVFELRAATR